MKKLFTAIRKKDFETVKNLINKSPDLISCVSSGAPKTDEGQSPLQVALKSSSCEIINFLLDKGADINFIESQNASNPLRAPVIHDAINRAIMSTRWNVNHPDGLEVFNSKEVADEAFDVLNKIILLGADVNALDSFGNSCLDRACLQARQILPRNNTNDRILTDELKMDLNRIFKLLIEHGADLNYISPTAFGKTYIEQYRNEAVGLFLK